MKKIILAVSFMILSASILWAQDEEKERGFKKENLFTGGSISLGFSNNTFSVGGSPVFGYNLTDWADLGIVVNYTYTSYRDIYGGNDKLRQSVYGGGGFLRLYPVRFLFAQAQFEHNIIRQKYIPGGGSSSQIVKADANSFLVGAGYTSSRFPGEGRPFFYLAILVDLLDSPYSPYTDEYGRAIPVIKGGIQVPLFQRSRR